MILIIVTVAAGGFLALLFRTDYDLSGIVTIFAIYMFYPKKVKGMGIGVFVLTLLASIIEAAAFLDMIPIYFTMEPGETDEIFLLYILSGTPVSSCHDRTGNGTLGLIF